MHVNILNILELEQVDVQLQKSKKQFLKLGNFAKKELKLVRFSQKIAVDIRKCFWKSNYFNTTPSRLEAHLVYKHTQKPDFLISNAR